VKAIVFMGFFNSTTATFILECILKSRYCLKGVAVTVVKGVADKELINLTVTRTVVETGIPLEGIDMVNTPAAWVQVGALRGKPYTFVVINFCITQNRVFKAGSSKGGVAAEEKVAVIVSAETIGELESVLN
jgi:hypothetical protein